MSNKRSIPINLNPPFDLSRQQVQIPIIPPFTESEATQILTQFAEADDLYSDILTKSKHSYPFQVHLLALPQFSASFWLQGISVQRISDQNGIKAPVTEICLELSRTNDIMSGIIYIPYSTILYLAVRHIDLPRESCNLPNIVIVDNMLDNYAKKV